MKSVSIKIENKSVRGKTLWLAAWMAAWLIFPFSSSAQNGEELFKKSCAACHSVGGGKLVGPDLAGVTTKRKEDWLIKFIKASQSFVKQDADAKAIFDQFQIVMPDQNLPDGDIKAILAYIGSKSPAAPAEEAPKAEAPVADAKPARTSADASTDEIALGKALFEGSTRFVNGGPACVSCHNVNFNGLIKGGVLAKDLTDAFSRLGGDAGVGAFMTSGPPAMQASFKDKALTEQEIFAVTAFLNKADKDKIYQNPNESNPLLTGGFIGFGIILLAIFVFWFNRKREMVRKAISDRQIKTH